ncbi:MAG TPA: hypothetical protein VGG34_01930 [Opitutaceae bacterium]|jgi:hypothetical protein
MSGHQGVLATGSRSPFAAVEEGQSVGELLSAAQAALLELRAVSERICESGRLEEFELRPAEMRSLCRLLAEGSILISKRADRLGVPHEIFLQDDFAPAQVDPLALITAYRTCCRLLCRTMKVSLRMSDNETALLLRNFVMSLEKQLWVIDAPSRTHGSDDSRAVSLFLAC